MTVFYTLGTSHGAAEPGRSCSVNLLEVDGAYYIFDCGGNVETKMKDLGLPMAAVRAVFISHMHEDHVGSLSAIAKNFISYVKTGEHVGLYMPEPEGIAAFRAWMLALHEPPDAMECLEFADITAGEIYRDERITVTAIPTKHLRAVGAPSFAFDIRTKEKRLLYTGDLSFDFSDYPAVLVCEDFDLVVSELVHFNPEAQLDVLRATRTKALVFTHVNLKKAERIRELAATFPFFVTVAEDNDAFPV